MADRGAKFASDRNQRRHTRVTRYTWTKILWNGSSKRTSCFLEGEGSRNEVVRNEQEEETTNLKRSSKVERGSKELSPGLGTETFVLC